MISSQDGARLRCRSDAQKPPNGWLADRPGLDSKAGGSSTPSAPSAAQANGRAEPRRRRAGSKRLHRRRVPNLLQRSWSLPLSVVLLVAALYAAHPTEPSLAARFLLLSYGQEEGPGQSPRRYGKGPWDLAFVAFYTVFLSFTREFCMQELLRPLARFCGIKSPAKQARFMEQMYTVMYIAFAGPLGMWCMYKSPVWYFNTRGMYEAYPHTALDGPLKFYYLFQAAFWVQQAVVMLLGLERRRKDFKELVIHHIATIFLIGLSYRFHFTHAGIAIYITHDLSDMVLAMSKSLNYIDSPLQIPCFAFNIASWIYLRHYINIKILYSVLTEYQTVGPFEMDWDAGQYKGRLSQVITFGLLAVLQLLNLFWLFCLFRVAWRILFRGVAKDDRSEDEEETEVNGPAGEKSQ